MRIYPKARLPSVFEIYRLVPCAMAYRSLMARMAALTFRGVMLDLRDLRYFVAVYETRGFGRAAAQLKVAQSNVSMRVLRLERLLGAPLFERRHRAIAPTARGDLLYRHALRVLVEVEELETTMLRREAC